MLLAGFGGFELATMKATRVPHRLKALGEMKAAQLAGCEWCLDFGSALSRAHGITDDELRDLLDYRASDRFSELEKLVLDYAAGMSRTPVDVPDELFARLREHFDEAQLVELTSVIALENYRARFNWAFGIEGEGFSQGAYCVRPSVPAAPPAPASSA
jgi:4-carboxymuconolactone decarboxylase